MQSDFSALAFQCPLCYDMHRKRDTDIFLYKEVMRMIDRRQIKKEARGLIRTGEASPVIATLIVLAVGYILDRVVNLVSYGTLFPEIYDVQYIRNLLQGMDMEAALEAATSALVVSDSLASNFLSILVGLFTTVLMGGYYFYLMGIRQGWIMRYDDLLDGLSCAGKLIWCSIQMGFRIMWWSLLLFIPGIVAAYRYRFALYNIMADSSLSASEAIALSCRQTSGMKWDLFVLDLSFLGWSILSSATLHLLDIWLQPYTTLCDLGYFEEAQRRLGNAPYGGSADAENSWTQ